MFPHSTSLCDCKFVYSYINSLFEFDCDCDCLFEFDCDCDCLFEFVYSYSVRGSDFDYNYSGLGFEFGDSFTLKGISNCYGP